MSQEMIRNCPDCGVEAGSIREDYCDVEMCSVCGGQLLYCGCKGHDKAFARWIGLWHGAAEADALGIEKNEFCMKYRNMFFVKPKGGDKSGE